MSDVQGQDVGSTPTAPARRKHVAHVPLLEPVSEPPFPQSLLERLGLRGLHCGSGATFFAGCVNTDRLRVEDDHGRDSEPGHLNRTEDGLYYLEHNAKQPYPFEDESFEWVYAEHFIEHLDHEYAIGWLSEARRLVRRGGLIRLSTPDLGRYAAAYMGIEKGFFEEHRERMGAIVGDAPEADDPRLPAWTINQLFYSWNHRWIYDLAELRNLATAAGFPADSVEERGFRDGRLAEVSALDKQWRDHESLYVEIVRA